MAPVQQWFGSRRCFALGLLTVGSWLFASGTPAAQQTQVAAVNGVVVDGTTGQPIVGAAVSLLYLPPSGGPGQPAASQVTDAEGRFVFGDVKLPASPASANCICYSLNASKPGYLSGAYGTSSPVEISPLVRGLQNITLSDGQWLRDVRMVLWRPPSISGTVRDERGEPVVGATVRAMARLIVGGQPQLAAGPIAKTDDRGVYRIANLLRGDYYVMVPSTLLPSAGPSRPAGSAAARSDIYPLTYYPAARSARDATAIALEPAQDRSGIDIDLRPVAARRIAGKLEGEGSSGLFVRLVPAGNEGLGVGGEFASVTADGKGAFAFENVPSGDYSIRVTSFIAEFRYPPPGNTARLIVPWQADEFSSFGVTPISSAIQSGGVTPDLWLGTARSAQPHWGATQVTLADRNLDDVVVTVRKGATLSGTFRLEGEGNVMAVSERLGRFGNLVLQPLGGNVSLGNPRSQDSPDVVRCRAPGPIGYTSAGPVQLDGATCGTFEIQGLLGGEYFLTANLGGPLKSVTWQGRDYTDLPFDASSGADITGVEVVFTSDMATVNGTVRDDKGSPAVGTAVVYFPTNRELWQEYGLQSPRLGSVLTTSTGGYQVPRLPAGEFYFVAVPESQRGSWQRADFLDSASKVATHVDLRWGDKKTADLVVATVK